MPRKIPSFRLHLPLAMEFRRAGALLENIVWRGFLNPQHLSVATRPHRRLIKHSEYQKHNLFLCAAALLLLLPRAFYCHQAFESLVVKSSP